MWSPITGSSLQEVDAHGGPTKPQCLTWPLDLSSNFWGDSKLNFTNFSGDVDFIPKPSS